MLRAYYQLTKPGIVYGNLLTAVAGYLFASRWHLAPLFFLAAMLGLGFVIASACVFNNFFDRNIDARMARTKSRPLVSGTISPGAALHFGAVLLVAGSLLLFIARPLAAAVALFGFLVYVFPYTFSKRHSHLGVLVGSVSGAVPITTGYVAASGRLDLAALILFFILALWQMPHFYAIALYRLDEYRAAGIPVLPVRRGMERTRAEMLVYIVLFALAALALVPLHGAGYIYGAVMLALSLAWLAKAVRGRRLDTTRWGRSMFLFSLIVLSSFSAVLALAPLLP